MNLFKNSFHYYGLFGFLTMYFYLHPDYTPPTWATPTVYYGCTALFCIFEFLNLMTHITLKNLRKPGTTERKIPHGWGFGMVSSANYLWEACAWITFCLQAQVLGKCLNIFTNQCLFYRWIRLLGCIALPDGRVGC